MDENEKNVPLPDVQEPETTDTITDETYEDGPKYPRKRQKEDMKELMRKYLLPLSIIVVMIIAAITFASNYLNIGASEETIEYNGLKYTGNVKKGLPKGSGTLIFDEETSFESSNIGTIETENFIIVAELHNNIPNGKGFLINNDGNYYAGDFQDGLMHGKGTFVWSDGSSYEGDYRENKREGEGTMVLEDGTKYIGSFKNNQMHGEGLLISPYGMEKEGTWVEGELQ